MLHADRPSAEREYRRCVLSEAESLEQTAARLRHRLAERERPPDVAEEQRQVRKAADVLRRLRDVPARTQRTAPEENDPEGGS